ncbi:multidrug resistance efflux pump [Ochrobactrum daejeonense]|uniref:Multidrug resistance efflux pump n=1 Tax=Brucella daejeonensis TaxID=659015 RepID=A0A7W9ELD5_9HYPH|nr:efflux RND transporter periplasmic adaptor subunit [Brucella daejeonensis]MBB5702239.1 multidrug resistance efflux pump [Brucella daejeonensis]
MKRLRKQTRIDVLDAQKRSSSGKLGRSIYLGLVIVFLGSLAYYLIGNMFVLSIDGTILKERYLVSANYPGKVTEVFVKEGDKVQVGTQLARIESFEMIQELANITFRDSDLAIREGQLQGKLASINAVFPLAERTARETKVTSSQFDTVSGKGIVSSLAKDDALRNSLQAAERVAQLQSEKAATENELKLLQQSRAIYRQAIDKLNGIYDQGYLRANMTGIVGAKVPLPGQVVKFSDELMQINGGKSYILAYLPDEYLFNVQKGMPVNISGGAQSASGQIDAILTVADALPAEFQNMFRPRDRSRLVRITLDEQNPFAVSQKVTISGCAFGYCWAD